ncbi:hypothetical protein H0H93_003971, partial [Arthromyces matolae]
SVCLKLVRAKAGLDSQAKSIKAKGIEIFYILKDAPQSRKYFIPGPKFLFAYAYNFGTKMVHI